MNKRKLFLGAAMAACLILLVGTSSAQFTEVWKVAPGTWPMGTASAHRGAALNKTNGHYLVTDRSLPRIYVYNASTGALLDSLNMTGVSGGGGSVLQDIEVAADGVVYASNLILNGLTEDFKIYRWADDNNATVPTVAYSGKVMEAARLGDAIDVAGSGIGTVIYAGGNNSGTDSVQVFTTVDGVTFTNSGSIKITGNDAGMGIAQITPGGDFLTSRYSAGNPIRLYSNTGSGRLDAVPTTVTPAFQADITYMEAAGRKWVASVESLATLGHNHKAVLLNTTYGLSGAVKVGVTPAIGTAVNTTSIGADVELQYNSADSTITIYLLVDNNGIAAYKTGNVLAVNMPPFAGNIVRSQFVPLAGAPDTIRADVQDDEYVSSDSVRLIYTVDGGAENVVVMTRTSGDSIKGSYMGIIPGSVNGNGKRISYYVTVSDNKGAITTGAKAGYFAGITKLALMNGVREVDTNGVMRYTNYAITTKAVVTAEDSVYQTTNNEIVLQDEMGGVTVFKSGTTLDVIRGNAYMVTGTTSQFNGKFQMVQPNLDFVDLGKAPPIAPRVVTIKELNAKGEELENSLVMIHGVMPTPSSLTWPAANADANMTFIDASGDTATMRVDRDTELSGTPEPKYPVTIVGVAGQFDGSNPFTTGYQWLPRGAFDIIANIMVHMKDTNRAPQNEEVNIPVMVGNITGSGILSFQFTNLFDTTALQFLGASNTGSISTGYTFSAQLTKNGMLEVGAFGAEALKDSGSLYTLKFKVLKQGPTMVALQGKFNEGSPMAITHGGVVDGLPPLPKYQDPKVMPAFASMNVVKVDGILDEPIWHAAAPYLVFGPPAFHPDTLARSVTGGADVKPSPNHDVTHTQLKFARRGPHFFIAFRSKDQSVSRFGDSWEGDGLFMKIKNAKGVDKEFKLYYNLPGNSQIHYEATDSSHGYGMAVKHPSTIVNDTTQVDSGYTAELVIKLDSLGFTKFDSVMVMINIFDPDGYTGNNMPWGSIGSFHKTWWGSEWGPDMRVVKFMPDSSLTGVAGAVLPVEFALDQNYPNPFNPATTIRFALPSDAAVRMSVYDILGREVRSLVNSDMGAGYHQITWDGKNNKGTSVASGMYIYRIEAGSFISTKKMLMLK